MNIEDARRETRENQERRRESMNIEDVREENRIAKQNQRKTALKISNKEVEIKPDKIPPHYLGGLKLKCKACDALHFPLEPRKSDGTYFSCCSNGKYKPLNPENLDDAEEELVQLFRGEHKLSTDFFNDIRQLNKSLQLQVSLQILFPTREAAHTPQKGEYLRSFCCNAEPPVDENGQQMDPVYGHCTW